jgi:hypothetical protein
MRHLLTLIAIAMIAACNGVQNSMPAQQSQVTNDSMQNVKSVGQYGDAEGLAAFSGELESGEPNQSPESSGIVLHSMLFAYKINGKKYGGVTNGLCKIVHQGKYAVGCKATFIIHFKGHIQEAAIALFTKQKAEGCEAAISGLYKNFNVHPGEKIVVTTFYWTGRC